MIPRLHLVTDDAVLARPDFLSRAGEVLEAGGDQVALHLRGPRMGGRDLYSLGMALGPGALRSGGLLLVNDRVDVALALGLRGVHLGQRSLTPAVARGLLGPEAVVGLSVHDLGEARVPGTEGASFLVVGSIYATTSHPERVPAGLGRIREIGAMTSLPLLAIGGVTPARVGELTRAGAHGIAVRGGVWDAEDPAGAVRVYLRSWTLP